MEDVLVREDIMVPRTFWYSTIIIIIIIIILLACPCNTGFAAVDDITDELLMEALAEFEERQLETPGF